MTEPPIRATPEALATLTIAERNFLRLLRAGGPDTILRELTDYRNKAAVTAEIQRIREKLMTPVAPSGPHTVIDAFGAARPEPVRVGARLWQPDHVVDCQACGRPFWQQHPRHRYCPDHRAPSKAIAAKPADDWPHTDGVVRAQATDPDDERPGATKRAREGAPRNGGLLRPTRPQEDPLPATAEPVIAADAALVDQLAAAVADLTGQVAELRGGQAALIRDLGERVSMLEDRLGTASTVADAHDGATTVRLDLLSDRVDALTRLVEGEGIDALDVTLGAVVQGLVQLAGSGRPLGELIRDADKGAS